MGSDGTTGRRTDGARPRRQDDGDDGAVFEPTGRWLTAEDLHGVTFWPATAALAIGASSRGRPARDVAFDPNGKWIAAASRRGGVEVWPSTDRRLPASADLVSCRACTRRRWPFRRTASFLATGTRSGSVLILPVAGSGVRELRGFQGLVYVGGLRCHRKADRCEWARGWSAKRGHSRLRPGDRRREELRPRRRQGSRSPSPSCRMATCSPRASEDCDASISTTGSSELLLQQPGAAFLGPDGRHVLLLRTENPNFPVGTASVYDLRERRCMAAHDPWRPGHADGLGPLRHARRDRQPGWDRAGRSRDRRRAAPPDRP